MEEAEASVAAHPRSVHVHRVHRPQSKIKAGADNICGVTASSLTEVNSAEHTACSNSHKAETATENRMEVLKKDSNRSTSYGTSSVLRSDLPVIDIRFGLGPSGASYVCFECGSIFAKPSNLKRHVRTHTGEKPFACDQCDATFNRDSSLKRHMRVHTGDRPYMCFECGASFAESSNLKSHERTHTGEKPFVCSVCLASFAESNTLKRHIRTHTGERPYKCTECNSAFAEASTLKRHIRTHGERSFVCRECGSAFKQPYVLKRHMRIHDGIRPYVCEHCGSSFSKTSFLKEHICHSHQREQLEIVDKARAVTPGRAESDKQTLLEDGKTSQFLKESAGLKDIHQSPDSMELDCMDSSSSTDIEETESEELPDLDDKKGKPALVLSQSQ